jgi:hypothetical protein
VGITYSIYFHNQILFVHRKNGNKTIFSCNVHICTVLLVYNFGFAEEALENILENIQENIHERLKLKVLKYIANFFSN